MILTEGRNPVRDNPIVPLTPHLPPVTIPEQISVKNRRELFSRMATTIYYGPSSE